MTPSPSPSPVPDGVLYQHEFVVAGCVVLAAVFIVLMVFLLLVQGGDD